MSALAALETAVRGNAAFDEIERAYLHRAVRAEGSGPVRGRDRIREAAVAEFAHSGPGPVRILHDLDEMIVFAADGWRGHRWAKAEHGRIISETVIVDGVARAAALGLDADAEAARLAASMTLQAPLGELRAGLGQLATEGRAALPHGFPAAARDHADAMHRSWNGRALGPISARRWHGPAGSSGDAATAASWMAGLLAALPDAVVLFERAITRPGTVALLWRLHGHHLRDGFGLAATGRRVRCQGSTVLTLGEDGNVTAEDTLIDTLALASQLQARIVDYLG